MRVGIIATALAALVVFGGDVSADAPAVTVTASLSRTELRYPDEATFNVSVGITTGAAPQTVSLSLSSPGWPDPAIAGGTLAYGWATITGSGTLRPIMAGARPLLACMRGGWDDSMGIDMPADATATVSVPVRAAAAPWPHADFTPSISWSVGHSVPERVDVPPVHTSGPSGLHIRLRSRPQLSLSRGSRLSSPRRLLITGTTEPALAGARIALVERILTPNAGWSFRHAGDVVTNRAGSFSTRPLLATPPASLVEVRAADAHPPPGIVPDWSCGPSFAVTPAR